MHINFGKLEATAHNLIRCTVFQEQRKVPYHLLTSPRRFVDVGMVRKNGNCAHCPVLAYGSVHVGGWSSRAGAPAELISTHVSSLHVAAAGIYSPVLS